MLRRPKRLIQPNKMAHIIPRGWLRERRPAPFDRRTPLILPGGDKTPDYELPDYIGEFWRNGNEPAGEFWFYVPVNKEWFKNNISENIWKPDLPGSAPSVGEKFYGPVAFSNINRSHLELSGTPLEEIWPEFISEDKFIDSGIGSVLPFYNTVSDDECFWSNMPTPPYNDNYIYGVSTVVLYVHEFGDPLMPTPPSPYNSPEWIHFDVSIDFTDRVQPYSNIKFEKNGINAILTPLIYFECVEAISLRKGKWELKNIVPVAIPFTRKWYDSLPTAQR